MQILSRPRHVGHMEISLSISPDHEHNIDVRFVKTWIHEEPQSFYVKWFQFHSVMPFFKMKLFDSIFYQQN